MKKLDDTGLRTDDVTDDRTQQKLVWTKEADMDARDIVKKSNYLIKITRTRRSIALKYIVNRCAKLVEYGLLSKDLPAAAAKLDKYIDEDKQTGQLSKLRKAVEAEIKKCAQIFRDPLSAALLRKSETAAI